MKTISDYIEKNLQIIQPSFFKRVYELRSNDELLATMYYPKMFGRDAIVEGVLTGKWEFYFPKFFSRNVSVRQAGYEIPVAEFINKVFSNKEFIELPNGQRVILKSFAFKAKKEIQTEAEETLVELKFLFSMKFKVEVIINKKSELIDQYPWLILLAIYIELQAKRRQS